MSPATARWSLAGAAALASVGCRIRPLERAALPADLVFRNGAVYTMDAARSWATAVAVRAGRITFVGRRLPAGTIGPRTEVVDLGGRMLLPGFQDGHVHPV